MKITKIILTLLLVSFPIVSKGNMLSIFDLFKKMSMS